MTDRWLELAGTSANRCLSQMTDLY